MEQRGGHIWKHVKNKTNKQITHTTPNDHPKWIFWIHHWIYIYTYTYFEPKNYLNIYTTGK